MKNLMHLAVQPLSGEDAFYAVRQKVHQAASLLAIKPPQAVQVVGLFSDLGRALLRHSSLKELRFWLDQEELQRSLHIDWVLSLEAKPPVQPLDWLPMHQWQMHDGHWVLRTTHRFSGPVLSSQALQELTQLLRSKTREELFEDLNAQNAQLQSEIDERKATEESLRRAQEDLVASEKLAALGGLVAGIAHEINTPLGIGVTAASHLSESVREFRQLYQSGGMRRSDLESFLSSLQELNTMVEDNLQRASRLIRSFKEVAVDQTADDERMFVLRDYVDQVLLSLSPKLRNRQVRIDLDGVDPAIRLHTAPGPLSQIFTNFIVNSLVHGFDAEQSGIISISAQANGPHLQIVYTDDGKGIAPEHLKKIFDPFFTTKREHGGSGLGMHLVYNIMTKKYGGKIRCDSQPGQGVRFELLFPNLISA